MSNKLLEDQEEDMERDTWPRFFKAFLLCCPTSVTLCCSGGAGILWLYTLSEPLLKVRGGCVGGGELSRTENRIIIIFQLWVTIYHQILG